MTQTVNLRALKFGVYRIEFYSTVKHPICARFLKLMSSGKNKGQYSKIEAFYFLSPERLNNWVAEKIERFNAHKQEKEKKQAAIAEVRDNFKNPYQVGEIFYASWGYDQTNIDFYEIVGVGKKSVVLRGIAQKMVDGSAGNMSEYVTPVKGEYTSKEFTRPIKIRVWDNKVNMSFNGCRGYNLSKYDKGEHGLYQSHYA